MSFFKDFRGEVKVVLGIAVFVLLMGGGFFLFRNTSENGVGELPQQSSTSEKMQVEEKSAEKEPIIQGNVIIVDLTDGQYYNLELNTYHKEIPESKRKSYKDEACERLLGYDANWKGCEELQVVDASGWRAVRFVLIPEVENPSPPLINSQYFRDKQAYEVGLFYNNHYFTVKTNEVVTGNSLLKIKEPKNLFAMVGSREGLVSSDVIAVEIRQPKWYPDSGFLSSPKLEQNGFVSTFDIQEIIEREVVTNNSPIKVKALFPNNVIKQYSFAAKRDYGAADKRLFPVLVPDSPTTNINDIIPQLVQPNIENSLIYIDSGDIYRSNVTKTNQIRLTNHGGVAELVVSPDRKYIAYLEMRGRLSHFGAPVFFGGDAYLKIIDSTNGNLKKGITVGRTIENIGPYISFFWDDDSTTLYYSITNLESLTEPPYSSYGLVTQQERVYSEQEFESIEKSYRDKKSLSQEDKETLLRFVNEIFDSVELQPPYEIGSGRSNFVVSPDQKKIAFYVPSHVCDYVDFDAPLIVYDMEKRKLYVVEPALGSRWEISWINDSIFAFSSGILFLVDLDKETIVPFLRDSWEKQDAYSTCYEPGPTVNTLCDQNLEYFSFTPFLIDDCSA